MISLSTTNTEIQGHQELCLHLAGRFEAEGVVAIRPEIEAAAAADAERIVVDLSGVAAIDGSGIGALAHMFRRASAAGRNFIVRGATGQPLALLQDLGLTALLGLPAPRRARRFGMGVPAFGRHALVQG